ncbi:Quinone oxidoreductase [Rubellimicrobium mesophilum DSM 19309]|uniref:Quinone oxidoreductase n=1 Tax=Rubellimicrobium mesophilum DSM 19309 TaxID=442562 RepID=A0A017HDA3_9RHOB|nr:quinone oxidoreductase [Rubellimicrobium mesophilum]EYD72103.1 Quinone oxidoreductase [Rubellimicrobium mesophilum DSM 19309]
MAATARTVVIRQHGGPEVLEIEERPVGEPGPGEVRIRQHAIGLNFIDVYQRSGTYKMNLPAALGQEGAGVVEAVGEGVTHLAPGDRAAYGGGPAGAYAEVRVMPAASVVRLPDAISFEEAAAGILKGLTVQFLFRRTVPIAAGDTVLFLPAAGGVGLIACQWARSEGIRLIAAAGSPEKCRLALEHGASEAIDYRATPDIAAEVRRLTDGKGVAVVMDGVGKDTFEASLDSLRPLGMMICFGAASGPVPPFDILGLSRRGSLKLTRPTMFTHIADPEALREMAADLFGKMESGAVKVRVDQRFPLDRVADAHRALESRSTTGSTVLVP